MSLLFPDYYLPNSLDHLTDFIVTSAAAATTIIVTAAPSTTTAAAAAAAASSTFMTFSNLTLVCFLLGFQFSWLFSIGIG